MRWGRDSAPASAQLLALTVSAVAAPARPRRVSGPPADLQVPAAQALACTQTERRAAPTKRRRAGVLPRAALAATGAARRRACWRRTRSGARRTLQPQQGAACNDIAGAPEPRSTGLAAPTPNTVTTVPLLTPDMHCTQPPALGPSHRCAHPCQRQLTPLVAAVQMHAAHRRRALADHQAAQVQCPIPFGGLHRTSTSAVAPLLTFAAVTAQMAARAGSPRHVGAAGPRPPPAAAAVAPDHQRPAAATTGDGLTSTYAARGGGGTTACTTHAYHNATVAKQDSGKAGLGRRSQAPPKHGADLRARKFARLNPHQILLFPVLHRNLPLPLPGMQLSPLRRTRRAPCPHSAVQRGCGRRSLTRSSIGADPGGYVTHLLIS